MNAKKLAGLWFISVCVSTPVFAANALVQLREFGGEERINSIATGIRIYDDGQVVRFIEPDAVTAEVTTPLAQLSPGVLSNLVLAVSEITEAPLTTDTPSAAKCFGANSEDYSVFQTDSQGMQKSFHIQEHRDCITYYNTDSAKVRLIAGALDGFVALVYLEY